MSNIIKNLWGNGDSDKSKRKASSHSKFCGICQEAYQRGKDDYRLAYCVECHNTGRVQNPSHWKSVIALQKANTLSPDLAFLASKLNKQSELLSGAKVNKRVDATVDDRNISEIRKAQAQAAESFSVVKAQVMDMLPRVLAELGVSKKVDAELLADMIVPTKIATPIIDPLGGRAAMKSIVMECLAHLDMTRDMERESSVRPHGTSKIAADAKILDEGFKRVSNDYGNRSRSLERVANEQAMAMPGQEEEQLEAAGEGPEAAVPHGAPAPDADPAAGLETGNPAGLGDGLNRAETVKLPDEHAEAMAGNGPSIQQQEDPTAGMLSDSIPTYSGGDNYAPDASDVADMPQEGVKRVEQSAPDFVSRKMAYRPVKAEMPKYAEMFTFAGKISKSLPVQSVRLSTQDRAILNAHQPINHLAAAFTDNSTFDWKYYATDSGYLMVSAENAFHTKSLEHFADFVETDSSFARWASLPGELAAEAPGAEPPINVHEEVDELALPEAGTPNGALVSGESHEPGDPGFNEIPETNLNPSHDNEMPEAAGLMNQQDAIAENSGSNENPAVDREEQLVDTATNLLPHIETMFPHESPEAQQDLAIQAALQLLEKMVK